MIVAASAFCCLKRRRAGHLMHLQQEQRFESERMAMQASQAEYQRSVGMNVGYQGVPMSPMSPGTPKLPAFDPRMTGYEHDHFDARSIDERPREGHGFLN